MKRKLLRIVAPFRPFPPEAPHHVELAAFDWIEAIRMLSDSTMRSCGCPVQVITDVDTTLPVPSLRYRTTRRRLMLWYLEIAAAYLSSSDFDRDTIMLDADQLVYQDLAPWLAFPTELGILIRSTPKARPGLPILNGVQFWAVRGRARLAEFYWRALAIAEALPEADIAWGADTVALERILEPLEVGVQERGGLRVRMIQSTDVLEALSDVQIRQLARHRMTRPARAVLDFRNTRKPYMRAAFQATLGEAVPA